MKLSLRTKLALLLLLVTVVTMSLSAGFVLSTLTDFVDREIIEDELRNDNRSVQLILNLRQKEALADAETMALFDDLQAATRADDRQTLTTIARRIMQERNLDYLVVTDEQGVVLARGHAPDRFGDELGHLEIVSKPLSGITMAGFTQPPNHPLVAAGGVPIFERMLPYKLLGVVVAGFTLDQTSLTELKETIGEDISLIVGNQRLYSSLSAEAHSDATVPNPPASGQVQLDEIQEAGQTYRVIYSPLQGIDDPQPVGVIEIARSEAATEKIISDIVETLGLGLALAGLGAIALGIWLASRVTQPLLQLTEAVQSFGTGDTRRRVQIQSGDEVETLGQAFNQMVDNIQDKQAQLQYQAHLLENVSDAIISTDTAYNVLSWNRAAEKIYGWTAAEVIGQPLTERLLTRYLHGTRELAIDQMLQQGEWSGEVIQNRKDGRPINILSSASVLVDQAGSPTGFVAVNRDMTQRRRIEEEVHRQALIFENLTDGVIVTDLDRRIIDWNRAAEKMFGYPKEEVLGKTTVLLHPPAEVEAIRDEIINGVRQQGRWFGEINIVRKDGSRGVTETIVANLYDRQGQPVGRIGINRDITDRKRIEQELQRTSELLHAVIQASPLAIITLDTEGRVTLWSPAAERIFGWTTAEVMSQPFPAALVEKAAEYQKNLERLLQGQTIIGMETQRFRKDGSSLDVSLNIAPLKDTAGNVIGVAGIIADISDRKQAEQALKESQKRYKTLFEESPISLWEEDFSEVKAEIDDLRAAGVTNFREYFTDRPQLVRNLISKIKVVDVNRTTVALYQAKNKAAFLGRYQPTKPEQLANFIDEFTAIAENETTFEITSSSRTHQGRPIDLIIRWSVMPGHLDTYSQVVVSMIDITKRRQAEKTLQQYNQRLQTIHQIDRAILAAQSSHEIAQAALGRLVQLISCQHAAVALFDLKTEDATILATNTTEPEFQPNRKIPLADTSLDLDRLRHGELFQVEDFKALPRLPKLVQQMQDKNLQAALGVPLIAGRKLVGLLSLGKNEPGPFAPEQVEIAREVADQLAIAIKQAELYRTEQQARRLTDNLYAANKALTRSLVLDEILETLLEHLEHLVPYDSASVMMLENESHMVIHALRGYEQWTDPAPTRGLAFDINRPNIQKIMGTQETMLIPDTRQHAHWTRSAGEHVLNWLGVPLISGGRVIGIYSLDKTEPHFFTTEHIRLAETMAAQAATAIQNGRLYQQVQQHAAELEQRVAERTTRLAQANAELEAFAYSVSHDLRAPLRAISGFAQIIARRHRANLNDEGRHYFDNIVQASEQMGHLIDDLLTYSRVGRRAVRQRPVPLESVLAEVVHHLDEKIKASQATLNVPAAAQLPTVAGDPTLLGQIFTNLLNNALTYHSPGAIPHIDIIVEVDPQPATVTVGVSDNGIGIAADYHEKIFSVFQRLHNEDEYPGTGIGLAIVKKSVELLNGQVWVKSTEGKGTTFWVELPLAVEERNNA